MPEELHKRMKKHSEIRWSNIARQAIKEKLEDLELLERITAKSKLTTKDAEEISRKIDMAITKKFLKMKQ